jgi:hypothetical protein
VWFPRQVAAPSGWDSCFCAGLYRLPLVPLILPAASISPSARRWFRPHYILGIRAAVPFVKKPLRFYASSWEPQIGRNSEYLCVVCVAILRGKGTTKRHRSAFDRLGLQCHSFSQSLSLSLSRTTLPIWHPAHHSGTGFILSERSQSARNSFEVRFSLHSPWCHVRLLRCGLFTDVVGSSVYKTSTDGTIFEPWIGNDVWGSVVGIVASFACRVCRK